MKTIYFLVLFTLFYPAALFAQDKGTSENKTESDEIDKALDDIIIDMDLDALIKEFDADKNAKSCTNESSQSKDIRNNIKSNCGLEVVPGTGECRTNSEAHFSRGGVDFRVTGLPNEQARKDFAQKCSIGGTFCQYEQINSDGTQTNYEYQDGVLIKVETATSGTSEKFSASGDHIHCQQPKGADSRFDFGNVSKSSNNTGSSNGTNWIY